MFRSISLETMLIRTYVWDDADGLYDVNIDHFRTRHARRQTYETVETLHSGNHRNSSVVTIVANQ